MALILDGLKPIFQGYIVFYGGLLESKDSSQKPLKESAKRFTRVRNQKSTPEEMRKVFEKEDAPNKSDGSSDS